MKRNKFIIYLCVSILFLVFPLCGVQASVVSLSFNTVFGASPVPPTNPGPWVKAIFTDVSPGVVDLKISVVGLTDGEKVGEVDLNLDPSLNPYLLAFSDPIKTGSFADPAVNHGTSSHPYDQYKADGDGKYDIQIAFDTTTAGAFNNGEVVEYTISLASLTASSFDVLSTSGGGYGPYLAVTHLQDTGGTSGNSCWAYAVHGGDIPEPATIGLLGLGVLGLRRRK